MKNKGKRIVFLDIDGVVCLYPEWQHDWAGNQNDRLSEHCCKNLKEILDCTDARVVITSSWRLEKEYMCDLRRQFARFGITESYIAGVTVDLRKDERIKTHKQLRWAEISDYISKNAVESYVIIDDFDLEKFDKPHFIKTKLHEGLTAKLKDVCIRKLSRDTV